MAESTMAPGQRPATLENRIFAGRAPKRLKNRAAGADKE